MREFQKAKEKWGDKIKREEGLQLNTIYFLDNDLDKNFYYIISKKEPRKKKLLIEK